MADATLPMAPTLLLLALVTAVANAARVDPTTPESAHLKTLHHTPLELVFSEEFSVDAAAGSLHTTATPATPHTYSEAWTATDRINSNAYGQSYMSPDNLRVEDGSELARA